MVLKKGEPIESHRYPRVLADPVGKRSCVQCVMCLPNGQVNQINVHYRQVPKYVNLSLSF